MGREQHGFKQEGMKTRTEQEKRKRGVKKAKVANAEVDEKGTRPEVTDKDVREAARAETVLE